MSNTNNTNTCMMIGLVIAAIIVGILSYYIGTVQPLWVAVVAFFILLAIGLWLVQKMCGGNEEVVSAAQTMAAPEVIAEEAVVEAAPETTAVVEVEQPVEQVEEAADDSARPVALEAARSGKGDDLKKIKGVGPKLEEMLNSMGFYHFDQIAGWNASEVAWVDENLQGFKGRVSRDNWVDQAKTLAEGGETEFSKKVDKGGVY